MNKTVYFMDNIDYIILKELMKDAKTPIKNIAEKVNLSLTPVHDRIKRLEKEGIIRQYSVLVDPKKLNLNLVAFLQIKLKVHQKDFFDELARELGSFPELLDGYYTTGEFDVILKVLLKDMEDYNGFILERISQLKVIDSVRTSFSIRSIFHQDGKTYHLQPKNLNR